MHSALGEPLRAEIDVTSLSSEEAGTLVLRVAPPDAYRAAGVEYNAVLPGTSVPLDVADGSVITIVVTAPDGTTTETYTLTVAQI